MTRILFYILSISFMLGCASANEASREKLISVCITKNWDIKKLNDLKTRLKLDDIDFDYSNEKFNDKGELTYIYIYVDCKDGFSGSADGNLLNRENFGFVRDRRKLATIPFRVGSCK